MELYKNSSQPPKLIVFTKNIYCRIVAILFGLMIIGVLYFNPGSGIAEKDIKTSQNIAPSITAVPPGQEVEINRTESIATSPTANLGRKTLLNTSVKIAPDADNNNLWLPEIVLGSVSLLKPESLTVTGPGYLNPDQQRKLTSGKLTIEDIVIDETSAWKSQAIEFRNTTLEELLSIVSVWYNVQIVFQDEKARSISLGGSIRRDIPLKDLLSSISVIAGARVKQVGNQIVVAK